MERSELTQLVKENKVNYIITNGIKLRLFISDSGTLCYFNDGSSRRGYMLGDINIANISFVSLKKQPTELDKLKAEWRVINKYRKYASETSLIRYAKDCLDKIPDSFEKWQEGGCKSLCELGGLTMGCEHEGKVITLDGIAKIYPDFARMAREALKNKKSYYSPRARFRGYDMTIRITANEDGTMDGSLSMEYLGCGNGYYYLLINENAFIGYDKD